jgi:hypothetical protein
MTVVILNARSIDIKKNDSSDSGDIKTLSRVGNKGFTFFIDF